MDLEKLKNRDYVLMIDKSGSMSTPDAPNGWSRWKYAQESAMAIARKTAEFDPDGITVVPFASSHKVYENTTPDTLDRVFKENEPSGSTNLAGALKTVFDSYNARKKAGTTKPGGEILLVITDGQPDSTDDAMKRIVDFGNGLENADDEYGISFIQIGKDASATAFLKKLDDELVPKYGAKYDIVDAKTIDEVEEIGLTETLVAALND